MSQFHTSSKLVSLIREAVREHVGRREVSVTGETEVDCARAHQIHLFIYLYLKRSGLSPTACMGLRREFLRAVQFSEQMRLQAGELLKALAQNRIPVIPLKGLWLAEHAYPDPAARPMHDLDVLVRICDQARAAAVMRELGYQAPGSGDDKHQIFMHPRWALPVELHVRVDRDKPGLDPDLLWSRAVPETTAGQPCLALAQDDLVLVLSKHILGHQFGFFPLRSLLDLALVLRRAEPALDLYALLEKARALNMVRGTGLLIEMAGTLAGFEKEVVFPPDFRPDPAMLEEAWRLTLDYGAFRAHPPETLDRLRSAKGWRAKIRILADRLFLPQDELSSYYPWSIQRGLRPLALVFRLKDLAGLYGRALWKMAMRDPGVEEALDISRRRKTFAEQVYPDRRLH